MTLLDFFGFDEEPFLMHPQYDYSVYLDNDQHKITSKVEFMITIDDKLIYPFNIYAIRVIGTKITFYKSIITREYLKEAQEKLPRNNKLIIKRFPKQIDPLQNQSRILEALYFTNEKDRIIILSIFKSLYKTNK